MKVKLLSNLQTDTGTQAEGSVIDLPDAEAEHLLTLGAAEVVDDNTEVTPQPETSVAEEVTSEAGQATDPLSESAPAGLPEQPAPSVESSNPSTSEETSQAQPADGPTENPEPAADQPSNTPETPASSEPTSPNLHLG